MTRSFNTLATVVITLVALLGTRRRELEELRLRAARRHLLGRLPFDLLTRRRSCWSSANASWRRRRRRRRAGLSQDRTGHRAIARRIRLAAEPQRRGARGYRRRAARAPAEGEGGAHGHAGSRRSATASGAPTRPAPSRSKSRSLPVKNELIDPLDAQEAGLHDAALEQGHEEISLNLEDVRRAARGRRALKALPPPTRVGGRLRGALAGVPAFATAPALESAADAFVERVFAKSDEYLHDQLRDDRRRAALSHQARRRLFRRAARRHRRLADRRAARAASARPDNPHDRNAIAVHYGNLQLGFSIGVSRRISRR